MMVVMLLLLLMMMMMTMLYRQSSALGWELIGICLAFFPPSSKCYSYLDGHIHKNIDCYSHLSKVLRVSVHCRTDLKFNQSINHLFVLNSKRKQVNAQYSVEQDTKAWNTYRCPKLSLIIKTQKNHQNMLIMQWLEGQCLHKLLQG